MNKKQLQALEVGRKVQIVKSIKAGIVGEFTITPTMEQLAGQVLTVIGEPTSSGCDSDVDRVRLTDGYYYTHDLITYPRKSKV